MTKYVQVARPQLGDAEIAAAVESLKSTQLISGPRVERFERELAEYVGTRHAVAVNSGTAALHVALAAQGIGPGDEVIVPALTFFSTVTAVIHQGAVPVFCDIAPDNYCLDPRDLSRCLSERTRAVVPVHFFGHVAKMDAIGEIAEARDLFVLEDCAQAHGSTWRGRVVGSIGGAGAFSFFSTKHMTTIEGGAVTTDDGVAADQMRLIRSHGLRGRNDHVVLGYNYRMTELSAAIGSVQLTRLDELNARRIANTERLLARISELDWLVPPQVSPEVGHTYFWCHIQVDEEKLGFSTQTLIERLRDRGVETRSRYLEPLYRQPLLTSAIPPILRLSAGEHLPDYGSLHLPNAEAIAGKVIGLPNRPDMTDDEIDHVVDVLHSIG